MTINGYTPKPGDAVFAYTHNKYGAMIRLGQAIRWWKYRKWNHMAYIDSIDPDGTIWCVEMAKHCIKVRIQDVAPGGHVKIVPAPEGLDLDRANAYARKMLGIDYGVLTIVSIAINLLMPSFFRFDIRRDDTLICSALVARAWEHGGWNCPVDPFDVTPAEFDELLGGGGYDVY